MTGYLSIIILTIVLFGLLAAVLLVPVYRFLKREEEASKMWTRENLERYYGDKDPGNGLPPGRPPRGRGRHSDEESDTRS
jgi:hypothetical protein